MRHGLRRPSLDILSTVRYRQLSTHLVDGVLKAAKPVVARLLVLRQIDGVRHVSDGVEQQRTADKRLGEAVQFKHVELRSRKPVSTHNCSMLCVLNSIMTRKCQISIGVYVVLELKL